MFSHVVYGLVKLLGDFQLSWNEMAFKGSFNDIIPYLEELLLTTYSFVANVEIQTDILGHREDSDKYTKN